MDLLQHLKRQIAFSRATFGPGQRLQGVTDHIKKELIEVADSGGAPDEWVDVVILALDGLTRTLMCADMTTDEAAELACRLIVAKQNKNERRAWPDWREADPTKAIEHIRSEDGV